MTNRKFIGDGSLILESSKKISKNVLKMVNSSIIEVFNDRILQGSQAETLRILSAFVPENEIERVAKAMLLLTAYRAEQSSPCAAFLFLQLISGRKMSPGKRRVMTEADLVSLAKNLNDPVAESMFLESVAQAGAAGNISVVTGMTSYISVDDSASFPVIVSPSFKNAEKLTSRKIVVYDGVIETVGQINAFLEKCVAEKANVLLLARAFSSDVASTIFANNQRDVFDIVPATPGVSFQDEFTLMDVAGIVGQDVLRTVLLDESKQHEMIVEKGFLKISLKNVEKNDFLVKLREELKQFKNSDINSLVSERIRRASSRRVSVCIGEEYGKSVKEILKEKFDYGMRSFISSRRKGVIDISDYVFPADSFEFANASKQSFENLARSTGGVLVVDQKVEMAKRKESEARRR